MRNAFLALLVVNLVYLAWAAWVDQPKPPPVNEAIAKLPRLKLISELPPEQRPATNTRTAMNDSQACLSVGPFPDIPNAALAAARLEAKGFKPRQRAEAADTTSGFWVYVGGLKSDVEADRVRVNLEKSGIKDALVMPPTADAGRRVSLGLFSDRARAEQRAASVKRMGFKAEVAEHKLPGTIYWIDLSPHPGMTTVPIQDLFAEGVGARIAVQACPPEAATTTAAAGPAPTTTAAAAPAPTPTASAQRTPASAASTAAHAAASLPPPAQNTAPKLP